MENMGDLSKIISVIMENPELIGKIRSLAENTGDKKNDAENETAKPKDITSEEASAEPRASDAAEASLIIKESPGGNRHFEKRKNRELLCALKPYVSKERAKTIDTFVSVIEIIGLMKTEH